ncbi:uncharacterized protein LOC133868946 [Alnus glutinosa]|uniref:uncharacterized protein LOC133868946 n=1 Tax=Alnus glutinosa TaxID=3517 RepID=UPI002D768B14|nr:uncharacterized protein LOC133868946 [Alnus glutinosa]
MGKPNTIFDFFKRKNTQSSNANVGDASSPTSDIVISENSSKKSRRVDVNEFNISSLEFDPGLRRQIWEYNVNQRDEIRRAYIKAGPYQFIHPDYPKSGDRNHLRIFQPSWFNLFPSWLEYSRETDAAFCLPCFLFNKPSGHPTQRVFTIDGFKNWKKLKASIDVVRVLAFQGVAFRGRDESVDSTNRGNFLEILNLMVSYNEQIAEVIAKAPKNASYTSPMIQKEILHIFSTRVKEAIRKEISNAKFCIMVDEARDESMKEQMAIVLRFVDKDSFVREPFFGLVHVANTAALTLQKGIYFVLSQHKLAIENIRGQGYDGASNMRELRISQTAEIAYLIEINEIESGRGLNQISTLQRAGDTRWSSHLRSVSSLIKIFSPVCEVILKIIDVGTTSSQRAEADPVYQVMTSFEFVFILHLMKETMQITDHLCQELQSKSQDILSAMNLVSFTKAYIQQYRDDKWDDLLTNVKSFCEKRNIDIPDMNARYVERRDSQLQELNRRFSEHAVELLILSSALDPRAARESFRIDDICQLVNKFYPQDFTDLEKEQLETELNHYKHNVVLHSSFQALSNISELCQWLVSTGKSTIYQLVFRVIVLVLTLPVSTATTERAFSAMNIVKTRLRNKIEDEFLTDSLMVYIEREIAATISIDSIIDDFRDLKKRRVPF